MNTEYEERPVVGYEGLYVVSNTGKVFSLNYNKTGQKRELVGAELDGYRRITLHLNGKREFIMTHRVVAMAFHGNPDNKPCIDHIDGDRTNNHASNLRWVTIKENNNNPVTRKSRSKFGVSIDRVYPIIPKDELPLGQRSQQNPISRTTFYTILQTPTDGRYAQCKALFDRYRDIFLKN